MCVEKDVYRQQLYHVKLKSESMLVQMLNIDC